MGALMSTLSRAATAAAVVSLSAATVFGSSATASAGPINDKLLSLLSAGYTPAACTLAEPPSEQDPYRSRFNCGPNAMPGGPRSAVYSLYGSGAELTEALQAYSYAGAPLACPGQVDPGPIGWQNGLVVCTTTEGTPTLTWTKPTELLAVSASGPDIASLYAWWLTVR